MPAGLAKRDLHLEVAQHRLQTDFHVQARVGTPRVAYREAPTQPARGRAEVERTLGGKEIHGCIELELRPTGESHPAALEWAPGVPIPESFRHAIADVLNLETQVGPRFGYPLARCALRVVGAPVASTSGASLVAYEVRAVQSGLRAHDILAREIPRDRFRATPGDRLLTGLRGKDVLLLFVESYGRVAVQDSSFSPGVDAVLELVGNSVLRDSLRLLRADGRLCQLGFLGGLGPLAGVHRLAAEVAPEKTVVSLDQLGCLCSTMFRVSPNHLLWTLEGLLDGVVHNRIVVPDERKYWVKVALDRMLSIS